MVLNNVSHHREGRVMAAEDVLRSPGRRLTRQRRVIYEIVRSRRDHPTADG